MSSFVSVFVFLAVSRAIARREAHGTFYVFHLSPHLYLRYRMSRRCPDFHDLTPSQRFLGCTTPCRTKLRQKMENEKKIILIFQLSRLPASAVVACQAVRSSIHLLPSTCSAGIHHSCSLDREHRHESMIKHVFTFSLFSFSRRSDI